MAQSPDSHTELLAIDDAGIDRAVSLLDRGGLVAIPTETVYGLGADAENPDAVEAIFAAKGRPADQPVIIHGSPVWIGRYARSWPETAATLASRFWPGPLTLVVPKSPLVPSVVTGGLESVGLRCPEHPVALDLIERFGRGIAAPSANRYGHVSPTTAQHVLDDLDGRIDAVVDGGASPVGVESTIVRVDADGSARLLRRGGISEDALEQVLGGSLADGTGGSVEAPGMVPSHYAPRAPVEVVTHDELFRRIEAGLDLQILVIADRSVTHARTVVLPGNDADFAAGLYAALRQGDDPAVTHVLVCPPTDGPMVPAIADRLGRASNR